MAWSIPSLQDITERTRAAFTMHLPGTDFTVWPNNITISAKVISGRIWELFSRQDYLAKQAFPLTADGEFLDRHAQSYGITRRLDIRATGLATVTGGTHMAAIPAGTQYQNAAGLLYNVLEETRVDASGTATLLLEADASGEDYNLSGGSELTMIAVIAGVPATSETVSDGINGGAAIESDTTLRRRLLHRLQTPPHAGSRADYVRWAGEVSGVTRVWVAPTAYGPGTVGVWFTMDDSYPDGVPNAADVSIVQAYIDSLKPITANVTVSAPIPEPVRIEITGLSPYTPAVVANVKAELKNMIAEKAEVSTVDDTVYIRQSWVWQAVANATGERYHRVVLPATDYAIPVGRLPVFDEAFIEVSA
ncbi:baseplate J/gp47 family protein [Sulfitobacter sp. 1A15106]|uniref:baseplate J/gp47 family protein n=1 Tax=Sulfitobacter sp. 1A15106 TaxID=3368590 RepID=UPI003745849F